MVKTNSFFDTNILPELDDFLLFLSCGGAPVYNFVEHSYSYEKYDANNEMQRKKTDLTKSKKIQVHYFGKMVCKKK